MRRWARRAAAALAPGGRPRGPADGEAPGLRRVAEVLAWYGAATVDQLAAELGLGYRERPALEAALDWWVRRGEVTTADRVASRPGGCAGRCCPAGGAAGGGASAAGAKPAAARTFVGARPVAATGGRSRVYTWAGRAGPTT